MSKNYYKALPRKWADVALVFTALGDEHRQKILLMFDRGEELTIKNIASASPLSRTAITYHIRVLREAGVLRAEKRSKEVFLRPDPSVVLQALKAVRDYVRRKL